VPSVCADAINGNNHQRKGPPETNAVEEHERFFFRPHIAMCQHRTLRCANTAHLQAPCIRCSRVMFGSKKSMQRRPPRVLPPAHTPPGDAMQPAEQPAWCCTDPHIVLPCTLLPPADGSGTSGLQSDPPLECWQGSRLDGWQGVWVGWLAGCMGWMVGRVYGLDGWQGVWVGWLAGCMVSIAQSTLLLVPALQLPVCNRIPPPPVVGDRSNDENGKGITTPRAIECSKGITTCDRVQQGNHHTRSSAARESPRAIKWHAIGLLARLR
jgi:hypothetical protein